MQEHFVAIGLESLYPISRERIMRGNADSHEAKPPASHRSEGGPRRPKIMPAHRIRLERQGHHSPERAIHPQSEQNSSDDATEGGIFNFTPDFKLKAEAAAHIASIVSPIQDVAESEQVTIAQEGVSTIKRHLVEAGIPKSEVDSMPTERAIVEGQRLLMHSMPDFDKVEPNEPKDMAAVDKGELSVLRKQIEKAGNINRDEEILTEEKVKQTIKVITEAVVESPIKPIQGLEKPIITSDRRLWELNREELVAKLKSSGINKTVPENWDSLKQASKEDFVIVELDVINEVEPEIEEIVIDGKKYFVWDKDEQIATIFGASPGFKSEDAKAILKALGKKAHIPAIFDDKKTDPAHRQDWMLHHGVRMIIDSGEASYDLPAINLTTNQMKKIFKINVPENWPSLSQADRNRVFNAHNLLPKMAGGGTEVPAWDDEVLKDPTLPLGPTNPLVDNPDANSRQDLKTVVDRRQLLLNRALNIPGPGHDWQELQDRLGDLITTMTDPNYKNVSELYRTNNYIQEKLQVAVDSGNPAAIADLDAIITPAQRAALQVKIALMNGAYEAMIGGMSDREKKSLDKMDEEAAESVRYIGGFLSKDEFINRMIQKAKESPLNSMRTYEGVVEYYVLEKTLPNVENILAEERDISHVINPEQLEQTVLKGLLKAEATSLHGREVSNYYQKVLGVLDQHPNLQKTEFLELKDRLSSVVNASLMHVQLYLATQSGESAPEKFKEIYSQIQNTLAEKGINTRQLFMERFGMRLSNGKGLEGKNGLPIVNPATGDAYDFNLLSDALNVHYWQLAEERLMFNAIEQAQRRGGLAHLDQTVFDRNHIPIPASLDDQGIKDWFHSNTLIGANTQPFINQGGNVARNRSGQEISNFERQMIKMRASYTKFLKNVRGLSNEQIGQMEFIIRAVNLNAYRWHRAEIGAEYDGIDTYRGGKDRVYSIFGDQTPYFERIVNNPFKWMRNERRGRVSETNRVLEETMPMGSMLPTVRAGVRLAWDLDSIKGRQILDIGTVNARYGIVLAPGTTTKDMLDGPGGAPGRLVQELMDRFETTKEHAEGLVLQDLIDNGNLRFGVKVNNAANVGQLVDWVQATKEMSRFNMFDLASDRDGALKFEQVLQDYLKNPTMASFLKVWDQNFYSGRNVRIWPNFKEAIKAHHKMLQMQKKWFNEDARGSAANTYEMIKVAAKAGKIDPKEMEPLMRELLGIGPIPGYGPVRYARFWAEFADKVGRNWARSTPSSLLSAFFQFWQQAFNQSAQQVASGGAK